jgi:putative PIN family toxin of toxin-antitoxin system
MNERPRIVLDTNVAIALIVFRDPKLAGLAARWQSGAIEAIADPATLAEFDRVLDYPELKLDALRASALRDDYRARCTVVVDRAPGAASLPRCSDRDDQMFLQLALYANADWLLTRDKALLKLRRRVRFRIALPERFEPD